MNKGMKRIIGILCAGAAALLGSCSQMFSAKTAAEMQPSYLVMETNNERVLFSQNANERRPIGMLSNIATAIVVMDWMKAKNVSMDTMLTVPAGACRWPSTNLLHLQPGEQISLRDALHSCLMWDDSACATTMAYACGYTLSTVDPEGAFVAQMNNMARTIGMNATNFKGSNGSVVSTASTRDLALLGMYAMERELMQGICAKASYTATINGSAGARQVQINNTNRMLSSQGVDGLRAANSRSAGCCIIASAKRGSVKAYNPQLGKESTYAQRLLVIVLGMPDSNARYQKAAALLNDGWGAWEAWQKTSDMTDSSKFIRLPKN